MIKLKNVTKSFKNGENETQVLHGIDLEIKKGEFVAIIGQSGSGKSTLMNILGCLDVVSSGSYELDGRDISALSPNELSALRLKKFGFIFQRYNLLGANNAQDNVALPAIYAGVNKQKRDERARELLGELGLSEKTQNKPSQLSGGQQQRVSIARALMNGGEILLCDEPTGALDSASGVMVMEILSKLHAQGHTIILVTHDKEIAAWAGRIVEIKDGLVVSDRTNESAKTKFDFSRREVEVKTLQSPLKTSRFTSVKDRFLECFKMSLQAIVSHKLRSFLTMLGIIIGIASVIIVVGLVNASQEKILAQINKIGTNTITLLIGSRQGDRNAWRIKGYSVSDAEILSQLDFVESATPRFTISGTFVYKNKDLSGVIRTGSETSLAITGVLVKEGRDFTREDVKYAKSVIIIDQFTKKQFFGDKDPLGEVILFNRRPFTIIGVAEREAFGVDESLQCYMPYTTGMYKLTGDSNIRSIVVKVKDGVNSQVAEESINEVMLSRRGTQDFWMRNSDTVKQTAQNAMNTMKFLSAGIAFISLIVGGIGVMNIMLVSVIERTKEIGLRMAVGAPASDILTQFLIEAVVLCLIGGVIGVSFAFSLGALVNLVSPQSLIFSSASVVVALAFSTAIGVIFGYMPAKNASKLNPIDALLRE